MIITIMPRRAGKTFRLIQLMKENPDMIMVCFSEQRADDLRQQFPLFRKRFVSYETARRFGPSLHGVRLLLDDVDLFLKYYFHQEIAEITITGG